MFFCALRTNSSRSSKRYAGSNGSAAFAGLVGATSAHVTSDRTIDALFVAVAACHGVLPIRVVAQDRIVVEADHIRSADAAIGARTAAASTAAMSGM